MAKRWRKGRLWPRLANVPGLLAAGLGLAVAGVAAGARTPPGPDAGGPQEPSLPIDRWLVTEPVRADSAAGAPETEPPVAGPVLGLFPDRDLEVEESYWHLVRRDGSALLDLDARFPDRPDPARARAHAYLRSYEDRTVGLRWRGPECGSVRLWLNGIPLVSPEGGAPTAGAGSPDTLFAPTRAGRAEARSVAVRLAAGWNTLLAEVVAAACPYRLEAWLEPAPGADGTGEGERALERLRVQASRPPGVRRTFPRPFVTAADPALAPPLRWPAGGDGLVVEARLEVAGWGAPDPESDPAAGEERGRGEVWPRPRPDLGPPAGPDEEERRRLAELRDRLLPPPPPALPAPHRAELRVRAAGLRVERTVDLEAPGRARTVPLLVPLDRWRRAARSGGIQVRLDWSAAGERGRNERTLHPRSIELKEALARPIELTGWTRAEEGRLEGEWRVPTALAGRRLELLVGFGPGRWTVGGRETEAGPEGSILLCGPCEAGSRLRLAGEPAEEGAAPRVRARPPDERGGG